jgi:hypothetical protein
MEQFRQATKRIDASDVVSLLREVYPEGVRGRNEAEALIAFDREFSDPAPEWRGFMAEAVADHLLRRSAPFGLITDEKATWLIRSVAPAGRIATLGGIEALIRTIELADEMPVSLISFSIRALRRDIITAEGPLVQGRAHFSRVLDAKDVALLRRILEAGAGPISPEEAEALFDLHDSVAESDNHASFDDLFSVRSRTFCKTLRALKRYRAQKLLRANHGATQPKASLRNAAHGSLPASCVMAARPRRSAPC